MGVWPFDPSVITTDMMAPSKVTSCEGYLPVMPATPVHVIAKLLRQLSISSNSVENKDNFSEFEDGDDETSLEGDDDRLSEEDDDNDDQLSQEDDDYESSRKSGNDEPSQQVGGDETELGSEDGEGLETSIEGSGEGKGNCAQLISEAISKLSREHLRN